MGNMNSAKKSSIEEQTKESKRDEKEVTEKSKNIEKNHEAEQTPARNGNSNNSKSMKHDVISEKVKEIDIENSIITESSSKLGKIRARITKVNEAHEIIEDMERLNDVCNEEEPLKENKSVDLSTEISPKTTNNKQSFATVKEHSMESEEVEVISKLDTISESKELEPINIVPKKLTNKLKSNKSSIVKRLGTVSVFSSRRKRNCRIETVELLKKTKKKPKTTNKVKMKVDLSRNVEENMEIEKDNVPVLNEKDATLHSSGSEAMDVSEQESKPTTDSGDTGNVQAAKTIASKAKFRSSKQDTNSFPILSRRLARKRFKANLSPGQKILKRVISKTTKAKSSQLLLKNQIEMQINPSLARMDKDFESSKKANKKDRLSTSSKSSNTSETTIEKSQPRYRKGELDFLDAAIISRRHGRKCTIKNNTEEKFKKPASTKSKPKKENIVNYSVDDINSLLTFTKKKRTSTSSTTSNSSEISITSKIKSLEKKSDRSSNSSCSSDTSGVLQSKDKSGVSQKLIPDQELKSVQNNDSSIKSKSNMENSRMMDRTENDKKSSGSSNKKTIKAKTSVQSLNKKELSIQGTSISSDKPKKSLESHQSPKSPKSKENFNGKLNTSGSFPSHKNSRKSLKQKSSDNKIPKLSGGDEKRKVKKIKSKKSENNDQILSSKGSLEEDTIKEITPLKGEETLENDNKITGKKKKEQVAKKSTSRTTDKSVNVPAASSANIDINKITDSIGESHDHSSETEKKTTDVPNQSTKTKTTFKKKKVISVKRRTRNTPNTRSLDIKENSSKKKIDVTTKVMSKQEVKVKKETESSKTTNSSTNEISDKLVEKQDEASKNELNESQQKSKVSKKIDKKDADSVLKKEKLAGSNVKGSKVKKVIQKKDLNLITESKPDNILNKSEKVKATGSDDQGNNSGKKKDIKKSNDETSKNQKSVNKVSKSKSRTSQSMGKKSINSSGLEGSVKKKIKVSKSL